MRQQGGSLRPPNESLCGSGRSREGTTRDLQQDEQPNLTGNHFSSLRHAVARLRNRLARWIATPDHVFNPEMSRVVDRLTLENESLKGELAVRESRSAEAE
jgi:hypothetical protein